MIGPGVWDLIELKGIRELAVRCRRAAKAFERAHGSSLAREKLFLMRWVSREKITQPLMIQLQEFSGA